MPTKTQNFMKTKTSLLIFALLLSMGMVTAQKDDKTAIMAVIERETLTFLNVDKKGWYDTWGQVPYAYWSYSDSTGTNFIEGWDSISKYFEEYFRTNQSSRTIDVAHQSEPLQIERTWKDIRIYGSGAFAHYTQRVKDTKINRDETSQIRILEKKDGKWKIVCVGAIANYPQDQN